MTNLLAVEVRRFLSRRFYRIVGILVLALIATGAIATFVQSERLTDAQMLDRARKERARVITECASSGFYPYKPPPGELPDGAFSPPSQEEIRAGCERDAELRYFIRDERFHMAHFRQAAENIGFNIVSVALIIGASFVGAEWAGRTIAMQLTWEPRRIRVFAAKVLACALCVFAAAILIEAMTAAALLPAALLRGTMDGLNAVWLRGTIGVVLRIGTVAAVASAITVSVAIIARNSAGALAVAFGYLAIFERVVAGLKPKWQPWLLGDNATIFVTGHPADFAPGRSTVEAFVLVCLYTALLLAAGAGIFHRTDIA
jgi:ABC-2 type transport system permease protein